jgi:hypothetical protein
MSLTSCSLTSTSTGSVGRSCQGTSTITGGGSSSSASRSRPRKSRATTRAFAFERVRRSAVSTAVNRVFTGTSVAPACSAPSAAITQ